jgi:cytochrome c oxidase cbb3-type subunit 3
MADMPTDFWSGWIALVTVISLIGLTWLVFSVYFSPENHDEESPIWDETLSEGSNPAPMWWFWLILAFLVFSVVYLMLYPGLGSYKGALKWSQGGRLGESFALYDYEFDAVRAEILESALQDLQADPAVMRSAAGIFSRNCAACHGPEAKGQADMFPNLRDEAWQWGGDPAQVEETIRAGRQAAMPAWGSVIGAEGVQQISEYVRSLPNAQTDHPGAIQFQQFCAACHGPDGKGMSIMGAPDLTDAYWLYGSGAVAHSIATGRNGQMPAFGNRLDDVQIRMLVAWLTGK